MRNKLLKIIITSVIVLMGFYLLEQGGGEKPTTSISMTSKTQANPSTVLETTTVQATTIPPNPDALPECLMMKTHCKKDRCYFGNALNKHNGRLCEQINEPRLRDSCIEKTNYSQTLNDTIIEGQIFNTRDCGVYANLSVEIRDETENNTITSIKTNSTGEYGFEVPSGKDYGIYVTIDSKVLNQNLSTVGNLRYVVDFALS